jgi:CRISPR-associated protein Cas2
MFIVVAYDIADQKRRRMLRAVLKKFGSPRQKSLFECELNSLGFLDLKWMAREIIEPAEDAVRCYLLCAKCEKKLPTGKITHNEREPMIV